MPPGRVHHVDPHSIHNIVSLRNLTLRQILLIRQNSGRGGCRECHDRPPRSPVATRIIAHAPLNNKRERVRPYSGFHGEPALGRRVTVAARCLGTTTRTVTTPGRREATIVASSGLALPL